ncbi:DUF2787 domain-containing protein [Colwellia psychrerythraea]|uniref:DUF2787 domain-containing protein n=1 Tax=Colwellia psychrerythraea (strain 34H / ATCC BAA-681) TaxID=167879 RepID=Q47ZW7_COLP3|nr:DUF2787 domain-containing protein [Colwellia psychrerythraea]AAZ28259.1 hypothetical protein CPS_2952 [Colwellia psychrerythraea 34H]
MKLNFKKPQGLTLPVKLFKLLNAEIVKSAIAIASHNALTFNFRDTDYSAISGGYHPVEIRVERIGNNHKPDYWQLVYITDFSYQGAPYPELVKEVDVCFVNQRVYSLYGGNLSNYQGQALLSLFISNFIEYHTMDTYEVSISFD